MVSKAKERPLTEVYVHSFEANVKDSILTSSAQKGLLGNEGLPAGKLDVIGHVARIRQFVRKQKETSHIAPSSTRQGFQQCLRVILPQKIDWRSIGRMVMEWIMNPLNMVLFLWICCVAVSGAILFLVMTGMLNKAIPEKCQRNAWFEVNNQILNALFTLICLYQQPRRFHHLVLLCRWEPKDVSALRNIYCKNGSYKANERAHMTVVVLLLHLNCFAQYALCSLNLGYKRSERPAVGVGICLSIAISAPAIAGVYSIVSPLGREYESEGDVEADDSNDRRKSLEKKISFASGSKRKLVEQAPAWRGGLFDVSDDTKVAYLTFFCGFCVFGWNMNRLGLGNMYVHIATFLLFCTAPFWIFNLAAINVDNDRAREALGLTGVILCIFGMLYGGFWRMQMRKRFNLPASHSCYGKPAIADCAQWLFCCCCSLAQEVRTADFYDIVEDKFYRKQTLENGLLFYEDGGVLSPLWSSPRMSGLTISSGLVKNLDEWPHKMKEISSEETQILLKPPVPSFVCREDNSGFNV